MSNDDLTHQLRQAQRIKRDTGHIQAHDPAPAMTAARHEEKARELCRLNANHDGLCHRCDGVAAALRQTEIETLEWALHEAPELDHDNPLNAIENRLAALREEKGGDLE